MSLNDTDLLSALYDGLASPPLSPRLNAKFPRSPHPPSKFPSRPLTPTPIQRNLHTPPNLSPPKSPILLHLNPHPTSIPDPTPTPIHKPVPRLIDPAGSLLPTQLIALRIPPKPYLDMKRLDPDSLTREKKGKMPVLSHLLSVGGGRVLSLAADEKHVYAGSQSEENEITVFSRSSLQPLFRLLGHKGSVLALMVILEKQWLVSSSSAGDVRIWSTDTMQPLHIIHPCDETAGDIYTLAWDPREGGTLYFGSQSASIEWVNFGTSSTTPEAGPSRLRKPSLPASSASFTVPMISDGSLSASQVTSPSTTSSKQRSGRYRPHSFFDNPPQGQSSGSNTPRSVGLFNPRSYFSNGDMENLNLTEASTPHDSSVVELEVTSGARIAFAHYGYVYAMHIIPRDDGTSWLVSGSGDSDVKIWLAEPGGGLALLRTFDDLNGAVLSFAVRDSLLYAGMQDGGIVIWDLETGACIRTIEAHHADVMAMAVLGNDVYTAAADGQVLRVNDEFDCTAVFRAHNGIILSSIVVKGVQDGWELITAGNDSYVKIWTIDLAPTRKLDDEVDVEKEGEGDVMLYALAKLVAVPTVSDEAHRESCRQGAHLLRKILAQLGSQSELLSGEQGRNPLVLATFNGRDSGKPRKRVLFYGHYDVQPAAEDDWETDPWELSGRNGYLYGRGVSDNKGPILAVACAAATLRQRRELDVDVVLLIEGEEEAGSRGFATSVRRHKNAIGHIDTVLLSNSTWIGESDPCVVFGMRGVVYAKLSVSSQSDDAHSGVDGGAVAEPMFDIIRVLGAISDINGVKLPGFYDQVRPKTKEEIQLLSDVAQASGRPIEDLVKVWRQPSLSIANISSSGAANKTVIPKKVTADISMRIVPDQDLQTIEESLKTYCQGAFTGLDSPNHFEITITHSASWWLTSLTSPYFKALEASVQDVWSAEPLKIREGGTVPTIFWLEQEFKAPCVHLPLGQASDAGHLANERMRLLNLRNGKRVVESYLTRLASIET